MADKNFKVKSGLQVPSLTTAGPVTTDASGNVTSSATLPISQGGTGQTTAGNALNALLPLQTGQDNKFFQTNGVSTQWTTPQQHTATDGVLGSKIYSGTVAPSSPVTGDLWIDQTTGNGIQLVRWRDTIPSTTTTLTGLDDNNLVLSYTPGNEQVYINGVLITRGQDYTATNGTSVVLTQAAEAGDTVEIFGNPLFSVTDTYTQTQADSRYVMRSTHDATGKNLIINGAMDFWQRGTSFTPISLAAYSADRWSNTYSGTNIYFNIDRDTDVPTKEYAYSLKATQGTTTATPNEYGMRYRIEQLDARRLTGKNITVSFWYKTNLTGSHYVRTSTISGVGSTDSATTFTVSNSDTWQRVVWTGSTTFLNITDWTGAENSWGAYLDFGFKGAIGGQTSIPINSYFKVTGVQLEIGSIATPFSRTAGNIQGELAACQRYFIRYAAESIFSRYGVGLNYATNQSTILMHLPVEMRALPTLATTGTPASYAINHGADVITQLSAGPTIAGAGYSKKIVNLNCTVASGLTAGSFGQLVSNNNTVSYLDFSAEL